MDHAHVETHDLSWLRVHAKDSEHAFHCLGLGIGIDMPAIRHLLRPDKDDRFGVDVVEQVGLLRHVHLRMLGDGLHFLCGHMAGTVNAFEVADVGIALHLTRIGGQHLAMTVDVNLPPSRGVVCGSRLCSQGERECVAEQKSQTRQKHEPLPPDHAQQSSTARCGCP
jgi:hypothetical protein